jgi:hypothetical protein
MPEAEDTRMPMREVMAKPAGMVMSWDQKASLGFPANLEKSAEKSLVSQVPRIDFKSRTQEKGVIPGSFTMSVAKLAIEDMMPLRKAHDHSLPEALEGCETMGPIPPALTMVQMRKAMPATGTT